eukprot:6187138-Pleurochrysis_carterae.AAC.3
MSRPSQETNGNRYIRLSTVLSPFRMLDEDWRWTSALADQTGRSNFDMIKLRKGREGAGETFANGTRGDWALQRSGAVSLEGTEARLAAVWTPGSRTREHHADLRVFAGSLPRFELNRF